MLDCVESVNLFQLKEFLERNGSFWSNSLAVESDLIFKEAFQPINWSMLSQSTFSFIHLKAAAKAMTLLNLLGPAKMPALY